MTVERVMVELTAEDIAHGAKSDCEHCPIARAFLRAVPGASQVVVGGSSVCWWTSDRQMRAAILPPAARAFIGDFDDGFHVEPFSFELDIPVPDPTEGA